MKKIYIFLVTLLVSGSVAFAQQSKSDEKLEFRPNWSVGFQGGASYTAGEAPYHELLSPAMQVSASYNFHHAMGVRIGLGGWQGKGSVVVTDEIYRFRFLQLNADYVVDLANLFGAFKHDRIWTPYAFAGIGGAYGFDNKEAGKYVAEYGEILSGYWESAPFLVVRAGAGVDFWVAKNLALGLEANVNAYGDNFNSKGAVDGFNPDFHFNALFGLKYRFGGNTRPSSAYAAKVAAAEAAAAALAAAEKAEAERLAAEKAESERLAAEKAAAERAAAEAAAKAAAEKAAAEHAALAAENSTEVFFTIDSWTIRKSEDEKLVKLAEWMKEHTDFTIDIVGYADKKTGNAEINMRVSEKRANAVKDRLVSLGVPAARINATFVGDTVQPFAENAKNRAIICTLK